MKKRSDLLYVFVCLMLMSTLGFSQNGVTTYMNPVQPGDHPDQTLMRVGSDFYTTGSSFHFTPYVPIYHSTDLVHWEIISRVVPAGTSGVSTSPGSGIWQGGLAEFGGYFWVYYSINSQQYFSKATSMSGPWSAPTKVTGSTVTGYDNSIFVDDDGTPHMLMKNGKTINRIQQVDKNTGQLTGTLLNCDWMNASGQYSWAEGPTMCKRNGRYYYFVAGNVGGGQYVLSTSKLSANESDWTRHGDFFTATTNPSGLSSPNHVSQPIKLDDGTWWCIAHAYDNSGWNAQGRLGTLHQVTWDASGVPHAVNPSTNPTTAPNLPNAKNIRYNLPKEDFFTSTRLDLDWHFMNSTTASQYSLSAKPGYMRLSPGTGTTDILQKEGGHYYTMVTKVDVNATGAGQQAGLRITNGGDDAYFILYAGYNGSKKIGFGSNASVTEVNNTIGNTVWLKLDRQNHSLRAYYSADGKAWTQVGGTIDATAFDKDQGTDYNKWVGTSIGLYAKAVTADFDFYKYKDGFSALKVAGYNNYNGVSTASKTPGAVVTNTTAGGWLMLGGVSLSDNVTASTTIEINAASASGGSLEIWMDNIGGNGTQLATVPITASGGADAWKMYSASVNAQGQHDLYIKFPSAAGAVSVNTVQFSVQPGAPTVNITAPLSTADFAVGTPVAISATAADADGTISAVEFYVGTTLLSCDASSPYTATWNPTASGTYTINAKAIDNDSKTAIASVVIVVPIPQTPYGGTAHPIPGTIQIEEYDLGGNGYAYYDDSKGSETAQTFRADEDVDLSDCSDVGAGYTLAYSTAGEWLEYTVDVASAGVYDIDLRFSNNGDGKTLSLAMDGKDIAADVAITNTKDWQVWQTVTVSGVTLKAGEQVLRVTIGAANYINLNYMTFTAVSVGPDVSITSPAQNSEFTTNDNVTIAVDAASTSATITDVKFYVDDLLKSTDPSAPYVYTWTQPTVGSHDLKVVATDSEGNETVKTITVNVIKGLTVKHLKAGWNLVGYPFTGSAAVETALSSVWQYVTVVKDMNAFWALANQAPLNTLDTLVWGQGYYIYVTADCDLVWKSK